MTRPQKGSKRLYIDAPLDGGRLTLDPDQAHYLGRVLRCRKGDEIVVFNARGTERRGTIASLARARPSLSLGPRLTPLPEPATPVTLLQALVKSDPMDTIVQKATELGVAAIFAVRSDFSVVRLDGERKHRKLGHWQRIAASACEQCGRHRPPDLALFDSLSDAVDALASDSSRLAFEIGAARAPRFEPRGAGGLCLAVGPEGGWSPTDIEQLETGGFDFVSLGVRTLRAETAAIAALAGAHFVSEASA